MAEKEKSGVREKIADVGTKIMKFGKYFANPIVWYILLGLVILLFIAGIIGFFTAMPGSISGWISEWVNRLLGDSIYAYDVTDKEVLEMAKYLEEMGYDLENYGFVETINRKENTTDGNIYINSQPNKGEIISVTSKYLKAYIGEEKKIYKLAPENFSLPSITEDYYLQNVIYAQVKDENTRTYYYYYIKGTDITKLSKTEQEKYNRGKENSSREQENSIKEAYNNVTKTVRKIGTGMIVLVGKAKEAEYTDNKWTKGGAQYEFSVNEEERKLLLTTHTNESESWFVNLWNNIFGVTEKHIYSVDLEEFICKYGKPTEFTVALHLATQAPDFTYKLATSASTDTKVYLDMWIRTETYTVVTEDGGDKSLLDEINDKLYNDSSVVQVYVDMFNKLFRERLYNIIYNKYMIEGSSIYPQNQANGEINLLLERIGSCSNVPEVIVEINNILNDYGISTAAIEDWAVIPIQGVKCSYRDVTKDSGNLIQVVTDLNQTKEIGTPYLTKVIQHWYRNQHFVAGNDELGNAKKIAINFLEVLKQTIASRMNIGEQSTGNETIGTYGNITTADLEYITSITKSYTEQINNVVEDGTETTYTLPKDTFDADGNPVTENVIYTIRMDVFNVIDLLEKGYKTIANKYFTKDTRETYNDTLNIITLEIIKNFGQTYQLVHVPTVYQELTGNAEGRTENIKRVIANSFWKIESTEDIIQVHNPIFEDNSQYIRNWLKEKYIIYDGVSRTEEERLLAGKTFIQGKTALENLVAMLDKSTTSNQYLKYIKRDVVEFMQDYEFDLDQIKDENPQKDLDNIMPAYVPYTPWPSEYEKAEDPWTKMIYKKSGSTNLVAPADCKVTKKGSLIEIAVVLGENAYNYLQQGEQIQEDKSGELSYEYIYLMADTDNNGKAITSIDATEGIYKRGEVFGTAKAEKNEETGVKTISIKLQMLTYTKQKIDITTRMNVRNKSISDVEGEKENIYIIMSAAKAYSGTIYSDYDTDVELSDKSLYEQECLALLNTALNRIASPYCSDSRLNNINYEEMGITKDIGLEKNDGPDGTYVWEFTGTPESDPKKERIDIDKLINLALKGSDKTKEGTILGATKYAKVWTKEDKDENTKTVDDVLSSYKLKQGIGGGGFYISDEEYVHYQKYYINNKIKSVFMQLNNQKDELNEQKGYTSGYGKYEISSTQGLEKSLQGKIIEPLKATIGALAQGEIITSIIVTDVEESIEENIFTDSFTIKINSNYSAKISIEYECSAEGKINYDTIKYSSEEVERL